MTRAPTIADMQEARARLAGRVHVTPVLRSRALDQMTGAELLFKSEHLQRTGAFKARGAFNAVLALDDVAARRGVVTHSSGNHAAALALAARERGIAAHVVMPSTAPPAKRAAVLGYGAQVTMCEPTLAAREAMAAQLVGQTGGRLVPPFDDPLVAAGQGTAVIELLEQAGAPLDLVVVPVGGGGLLAGTAVALAALSPGTRLVATEPELADDAAAGLRSGTRQPQRLPVATIADGLTTAMSDMTFGVMQAHVAQVATVSEDAIRRATRLIWQRMKQVVEPSAAVPLAALLAGGIDCRGLRVGVILTGGNIDLDRLPWT